VRVEYRKPPKPDTRHPYPVTRYPCPVSGGGCFPTSAWRSLIQRPPCEHPTRDTGISRGQKKTRLSPCPCLYCDSTQLRRLENLKNVRSHFFCRRRSAKFGSTTEGSTRTKPSARLTRGVFRRRRQRAVAYPALCSLRQSEPPRESEVLPPLRSRGDPRMAGDSPHATGRRREAANSPEAVPDAGRDRARPRAGLRLDVRATRQTPKEAVPELREPAAEEDRTLPPGSRKATQLHLDVLALREARPQRPQDGGDANATPRGQAHGGKWCTRSRAGSDAPHPRTPSAEPLNLRYRTR
jgi:hypothetical protein